MTFLMNLMVSLLMISPAPIDTAGYSEPELFIVEASAYNNPNGNKTASGNETIEGLTVAAKKDWIGLTVVIYNISEDGSVGELIGYYEIQDTGYGKDSKKYPGKGTIQTGECIDIYMESRDDAIEWGRRNVYIQLIDAVG